MEAQNKDIGTHKFRNWTPKARKYYKQKLEKMIMELGGDITGGMFVSPSECPSLGAGQLPDNVTPGRQQVMMAQMAGSLPSCGKLA